MSTCTDTLCTLPFHRYLDILGDIFKSQRAKGLVKYVRYNEISLYLGYFPYITIRARKIVHYTEDFVI